MSKSSKDLFSKKQCYSIRKLAVGVYSLLIGATIVAGGVEVLAEETSGETSIIEQADQEHDQLDEETLSSVGSELSTQETDNSSQIEEIVSNNTDSVVDTSLGNEGTSDANAEKIEPVAEDTTSIEATVTETNDKSVEEAIKEASEDLTSLENGDNPLFKDTSETSNKFGLPFVVIKDKDTNKIIEGGQYRLIALSRDSDTDDLSWSTSDVIDYTMNGTGKYISKEKMISPYPSGYSSEANNLLAISELTPPAGYESNPFLLVMVPTSNGWAAKTYKLSNEGQYFEVELDERNISSVLETEGNYTGFAIPYKRLDGTVGVETPITVSEMPLEEITTNRGPFDNNELVKQAIKDTIDTPDIIAASQFSTVDAANLTSQPGGLFVLFEADSKVGSPYEIDTAVNGGYGIVSSTLDNYVTENIAAPREGYEKRFVFYEQSAPEGYYLNPITIVMVQQDDGWHIKSYYNGTGDKSHYHPAVLDSFNIKDGYSGEELPQILIPHNKIIDSETAANDFNDYHYELSDTPKASYDNIITAKNDEFDSYFTPGELTTHVLISTTDYFSKESVGGSVYQYTVFNKQDDQWLSSVAGEILMDTNGHQFFEQLFISDNTRIVLREVTAPSGYVKNPIILTLSNENSGHYLEFNVNYFQDEESNGYYLNPDNGSRHWENSPYSLVIPHIPIKSPAPEPASSSTYDELPETGETNNVFLNILGVFGLITSFGLVAKRRRS